METFLDVHLDLTSGTYKPYHKPNSNPIYVNVGSNHPKSVLKNIPLGVNERLSMTSSNEQIFNANKGIYQEALDKAGHKHELKYVEKDIDTYNKKKKASRQKKQYFFNPPYELNVKTNVAKEVFKALERTIPKGHTLYPLLNRHTVKVAYSTMPNLQKKVSSHNKKILKEAEKENQQNLQQNLQQQNLQQQNLQQGRKKKEGNKDCNCRGGTQNCPLDGKCLKEKNVVYVAKVLRLDNFHEETYTGVHEGPFKTRLYGHNFDIRHKNKKGKKGTKLSNYIWKLKDNQPHPIPYELEWDILGKEKPYNQVTGVCRLCLFEAYFLMFDKTNCTLNSRSEYFSACPHKRKYLLKYV